MKKTESRNPFYEEIQRNGITIDVLSSSDEHPGPSRNPYYARIRAAGGIQIHAPGRPKRGEVRQPTAVRSVRLPIEIWKRVQAQAKRERISLNAALRQAAQIWLKS